MGSVQASSGKDEVVLRPPRHARDYDSDDDRDDDGVSCVYVMMMMMMTMARPAPRTVSNTSFDIICHRAESQQHRLL